MQTKQETTQTKLTPTRWMRCAMPLAGLLAIAGIAFGVMSQSAMAATFAKPTFAAVKASQPMNTTATTATTPITNVVTATVSPTSTVMKAVNYVSDAQAIYSDTERAIKNIAATLNVSGTLDVATLQSSLDDLNAISAHAKKLAVSSGKNRNLGKKLALLVKRIRSADKSINAELKQTAPNVAKIKSAFAPVVNANNALNSALNKSVTTAHDKSMSSATLPESAVAPVDAFTCPADHAIKGNNKKHIYHVPTSNTYKETKPEACFATAADAEAAGYRAEKQ